MSYFSYKRLVWSCILAAMPTSLFAVDGVVLIDQSHALAGNITPGDAPGFPVTISQSGSYRLSGNLTVTDLNTTAIQITADDVTLDLNGFSIVGPNVCNFDLSGCSVGSGLGVQAGALNSISGGPRSPRVLNGTVRGMGSFGIRITGDGGLVDKMVALNNGSSGIEADSGNVTDSTASFNLNEGIRAKLIRSSIAEGNGSTGISVLFQGVAIGNLANSNAGSGIIVQNGTATNNTANNNKAFGLEAVCPSALVGNTAVGNPLSNVILNGIGNCVTVNNAQ